MKWVRLGKTNLTAQPTAHVKNRSKLM